jgi:hypothetical protein
MVGKSRDEFLGFTCPKVQDFPGFRLVVDLDTQSKSDRLQNISDFNM